MNQGYLSNPPSTDLLTQETNLIPDTHVLGGTRTRMLQLTVTEETGRRHSCGTPLLDQWN